MYAQGLGMPQDKVLAYKWVSLAASRLAASEKKSRDDAVNLRDQIASKMTAAQIDEAQKLARDWRSKPE
jgi:TPR repeat protein